MYVSYVQFSIMITFFVCMYSSAATSPGRERVSDHPKTRSLKISTRNKRGLAIHTVYEISHTVLVRPWPYITYN